jgi:3D (Asp-Asp-Asp) domain-containing protein
VAWRRSILLSRSFKRKVVATCGAALGFALLYEAHTSDARYAAEQDEQREATRPPAPGARLRFTATAYCKGETTAAGTAARTGVAAADPALLPVGSVVQVEIDSLGRRYNGIYTIMDTGPAVQGRELDLYMWSCQEALGFGRRNARVMVLRLGWNPRASDPTLVGAEIKRREAAAALAPAPAAPPAPAPSPAAVSGAPRVQDSPVPAPTPSPQDPPR